MIVLMLVSAMCQFTNIVSLPPSSSSSNNIAIEDFWLFISPQFYESPATTLYILPEFANGAVCFTFELMQFATLIQITYRTYSVVTPFSQINNGTLLASKIIIGNEWSHILSDQSYSSRKLYINQIQLQSKQHIGCMGDKHLLTIKNGNRGVYVRNYRLWSVYISPTLIWDSNLDNSILHTPRPIHAFSFATPYIQYDQGSGQMEPIENSFFAISEIHEYTKVHQSFPSKNAIMNSEFPLYTHKAMSLNDSGIVLPNAVTHSVISQSSATITFWIKLTSIIGVGAPATIMKVCSTLNNIETQHMYMGISSTLVYAVERIYSIDWRNDNTWNYFGVAFEEILAQSTMTIFSYNATSDGKLSTSSYILTKAIESLFPIGSSIVFPKTKAYLRSLSIWSTALSSSEFVSYAHYRVNCINFPNLIENWPFDDDYDMPFYKSACNSDYSTNMVRNYSYLPNQFNDIQKYDNSWESTRQYLYDLCYNTIEVRLSSTYDMTLMLWVYLSYESGDTISYIDGDTWSIDFTLSSPHAYYQLTSGTPIYGSQVSYNVWKYYCIQINQSQSLLIMYMVRT